MHKQSLEFLQLFNAFEAELKKQLNRENYVNYSRLLDEAAEENYFIKKNKSMLSTFGDLRNVVVHQEGNMVTAIPTIEAIQLLKSILETYKSPKTVFSITHKEVVSISAAQTLDEALLVMAKHDYTQLPIIDQHQFVGLLTSKSMTRFIANTINRQGELEKSLSHVGVKEVLAFQKPSDQVRFVPKNMTVNQFISLVGKDPSPSGVYFFTQSGKMDEAILGICTDGDFPKIWNALA